jgi:hypothetical protein
MSKIDLSEDNMEDGEKDQEFIVISMDELKQILQSLTSLDKNLQKLLDNPSIGKYMKD